MTARWTKGLRWMKGCYWPCLCRCMLVSKLVIHERRYATSSFHSTMNSIEWPYRNCLCASIECDWMFSRHSWLAPHLAKAVFPGRYRWTSRQFPGELTNFHSEFPSHFLVQSNMPENPCVFNAFSCVRGASGSCDWIFGKSGKTDDDGSIKVVLLEVGLRCLFALSVRSADISMDEDWMHDATITGKQNTVAVLSRYILY
jgi:hypothetical protein